eukprot:4449580-Heterocapsa_arctica.AAC.1
MLLPGRLLALDSRALRCSRAASRVARTASLSFRDQPPPAAICSRTEALPPIFVRASATC